MCFPTKTELEEWGAKTDLGLTEEDSWQIPVQKDRRLGSLMYLDVPGS